MSTFSYRIQGGDFDRIGSASGALKRNLKSLGVDPAALRRAVIAAYEAEANIVIHAERGVLHATLSPFRIDMEAADEGQGIADIEQAMAPGFSTASCFAREMGFGAGLGLPNIRKHSDRFTIESRVGQGTRLNFSINLGDRSQEVGFRSALHIKADRCRRCMKCIRICPTEALRIGPDGPRVLEHLCIDCGSCIRACPTEALKSESPEDLPARLSNATLIAPPVLMAEFADNKAQAALKALNGLGFGRVVNAYAWEEALLQASLAHGGTTDRAGPVIAPLCPAVLNLVQLRFPSLLPAVAPFLTPLEAACSVIGGERVVVAVACPAQESRLKATAKAVETVGVRGLRRTLLEKMASISAVDETSLPEQASDHSVAGTLRATGMRHVMGVLDQAEDGLLRDFAMLELWACDEGCFGSPLLDREPVVSRNRWLRMKPLRTPKSEAVRRANPLTARRGVRLDEDMARAVQKLARIESLRKALPGRDCGLCGAPSCEALAKDIVLDQAEASACPLTKDGVEI